MTFGGGWSGPRQRRGVPRGDMSESSHVLGSRGTMWCRQLKTRSSSGTELDRCAHWRAVSMWVAVPAVRLDKNKQEWSN